MQLYYFDLATTGWNASQDEILAIGGVCNDWDPFFVEVNPDWSDIHPQAGARNGYSVDRRGNLRKFGRLVENPLEQREALMAFVEDIYEVILYYDDDVQLIAHNGFAFDFKLFLRSIFNYNVIVPSLVRRHCYLNDSLHLAWTMDRLRTRGQERPFSLDTLLWTYCGRGHSFDALQAALDTRAVVNAMARSVRESKSIFVNRGYRITRFGNYMNSVF